MGSAGEVAAMEAATHQESVGQGSLLNKNGVSVGPDAAERATADDAVGRAHQHHDWHVRARGANGVRRGGRLPVQSNMSQERPCLPRKHGRTCFTYLTGNGTTPPAAAAEAPKKEEKKEESEEE